MVDVFSGLGGASAAMKDRGWRVTTIDIDPKFNPDICADVRKVRWPAIRPAWRVDLLWLSPPCDEFARESMPWCKTGVPPSLDMVRASMRLRDEIGPRFWLLEEVRGARRYLDPLLGPPLVQLGPSQSFLWGNVPALLVPQTIAGKERKGSTAEAARAAIRYDVSNAVAIAVERAIEAGLG